jgi:ATP-dependent RNA helicase DDX3X
VDILVATPGRLVDMVERSKLSFEAIQYFIVDDIERVLDMGFELMIKKIVGLGMPQKSVRQTMLFTGKLRPELQVKKFVWVYNQCI